MSSLKTDSYAEENLGLVHLCANKFRGRGIEYDDLYGAGCIGLVKAASAFDTERGVKFSTYAVPVILGEIKRLFRDGGSVKVSRSIKENSLKITREKENFIRENNREPTVSELSRLLETSEENIIEALMISLPPISLTEQNDDEKGSQIDIKVESPDRDMVDILSLRQAMGSLDTEDRKLIYLRYFKEMTQKQVADQLNITQVQVSRREKKLLSKLKNFLLE